MPLLFNKEILYKCATPLKHHSSTSARLKKISRQEAMKAKPQRTLLLDFLLSALA